MVTNNKTKAKISKEDYKRIRAKIKVKLGAYKINPDKAESYLERFKGLDIASIGEERVELLIKEEAGKSEDPSVLFELGVISETLIKWENKKKILDALITFTNELKKSGRVIEELEYNDFVEAGLARLVFTNTIYDLLKMVKPDLKPWQLTHVPRGYWGNPKNVKEAVVWFVEEMRKKGKRIEEISVRDFRGAGLERLVNKYKLCDLLKMVKPDLKPWQLNRVPDGYWDDPKNVKEAVGWLVEEMAKEGKRIEEITTYDFKDTRLTGLIETYGLYELLRRVKPDLKPWQLKETSNGYWDDPEHVKEAVKWLVEEKAKEGKGVGDITKQDFIDSGLTTLVRSKSVYSLLKLVKPDLKPWQLRQVTAGYWDDLKNVKEAVGWLVEEMAKEGKKIEEITYKDFVDAKLGTLVGHYKLYNLLKMVKPDLKPWQLNRVPDGYWDDPKNVKEAVEWLVEEMAKKGKKIEEITGDDFIRRGLTTLIQKYDIYILLKMVKPDLKPYELKQIPFSHWDNLENVKEAVEWLVEEMAKEGKRIEKITRQDFINAGLEVLLRNYRVDELLRIVKPDLKPWQLNRVPYGYWNNPKNVKEVVKWLVEKKAKEGKRIEEITRQDFFDAGLKTLICRYKKTELLRMVKPDYKNDK